MLEHAPRSRFGPKRELEITEPRLCYGAKIGKDYVHNIRGRDAHFSPVISIILLGIGNPELKVFVGLAVEDWRIALLLLRSLRRYLSLEELVLERCLLHE